MKRTIAVILALVFCLGLCACGGPSAYETISGSWYTEDYLEEDDTLENLKDYCEFFDSEIAYADLSGCALIRELTLNMDKTYFIGISEEQSILAFRNYLESFIHKLYEHRAEIEEYCGEADEIASVEEFWVWYMDAFYDSDATLDDYLDYYAEELFDLYELTEERGVYTATSKEIHYTITGESETTSTTYELNGDRLMVHFADADVEYHKLSLAK